jgi:hypothetical protein
MEFLTCTAAMVLTRDEIYNDIHVLLRTTQGLRYSSLCTGAELVKMYNKTKEPCLFIYLLLVYGFIIM